MGSPGRACICHRRPRLFLSHLGPGADLSEQAMPFYFGVSDYRGLPVYAEPLRLGNKILGVTLLLPSLYATVPRYFFLASLRT